MNKKLRLSLALEMFGNKDLLKAISLLLIVRKRTGSNVVNNYTVYKLVSITGAHASTIRKRMQVLSAYGLAELHGKDMIFRSIVSRHKDRNIRLGERKVEYKSLKSIEYSMQAILVAVVQSRKDFAKRTIRNAHGASHDYKVVKAAMGAARRFGWGVEYVERGLSYKTIAKKLGVCVKSAVEIVKFAIKRGILKKQTHQTSVCMPCVSYREVEGFTFTTRNYGYIVEANTYAVAPCLCLV